MRIRTLDIEELNDRMAELEALRDAVSDEQDNLAAAENDAEIEEYEGRLEAAKSDFGPKEEAELKALEDLRDEIGEGKRGINDEGGPFVHENDFEDYARELAEDIGAIPEGLGWPCTCIDWERAADELKMDYSSIEWNGVTYFYRS